MKNIRSIHPPHHLVSTPPPRALTFSDLKRKRRPSMCFRAKRQLLAFSNESSHAHACMSHIDPASPPPASTMPPPYELFPPPPLSPLPPNMTLVAPPPLLPKPPPVVVVVVGGRGVDGQGGVTGRMRATGWCESALIWRRVSSAGSGADAKCSSGAVDFTSPLVRRCLYKR